MATSIKERILQDAKNKKSIEDNTQTQQEHYLNIKEVGFLLSLMDESHHAGKHLELALRIKVKLQSKLNQLMNNMEDI
tara:strand:+ start:993 stop:1226 length:234 start_codon:yes stop_codon:yes gene_type:complete